MLSKLTYINANTSALTGHGWLSFSSLGVFRCLGHKKRTTQFLQFVAEVNVPGIA